MATERLYHSDSHLTQFDARVTAITKRVSGWVAVTLDRTAFYPTGGGQPSDTGMLNESEVVECIDAEEQGVLHVVHGGKLVVGDSVKGRVNWNRRLDHMQQHTGQHILSQAFIQLFNAETRGFRMQETYSEIDVALEDPTEEKIDRAVELANSIIWEDRPVHVRQVTKEESAELPLRKESAREGELRLIEIEGYDLTPCGGTHAHRTGEIGVIAVRSFERAKGLARIEFVAGGRALADYNSANRNAREIAGMFSVGRDEGPAAVTRLFDENKEHLRRVRALEEIAARVEAEELLRELDDSSTVGSRQQQSAGTPPNARVIARAFEGRDVESLKRLAQALIAHPGTIALLGSRDGDTARLVFARSEDAPGDMNALMKKACEILDGRGGGKPDMAQGGGKSAAKLEDAIAQAARSVS